MEISLLMMEHVLHFVNLKTEKFDHHGHISAFFCFSQVPGKFAAADNFIFLFMSINSILFKIKTSNINHILNLQTISLIEMNDYSPWMRLCDVGFVPH
jgi:hypothetical protein